MDYNWSKKRKYLASEGNEKDPEPEKIVKKKKIYGMEDLIHLI